MDSAQRHTLSVLLATAVLFAVFWVGMRWYQAQRERDREGVMLSCIMQLVLASGSYERDHHHLPDAGKWEGELTPYLGSDAAQVLHPPPPVYGHPRRFALNRAVSGRKLDSIKRPDEMPLFFESVSQTPSSSDNLDSFPRADRDGGRYFAVSFVSGDRTVYPHGWVAWVKANPDQANCIGLYMGHGESRPWMEP